MRRAGFGLVLVLAVGCDKARVETLERRVEALEKKDTEQATMLAAIGNPADAIAKLEARIGVLEAEGRASGEKVAKLHLQIAELEASSQSLEQELAKLVAAGAIAAVPGGLVEIGIPECDEYIQKYSKCVADKVPGAARKAMLDAMDTTAKAWKEAADGPARTGLATACKAALAAAQKATKPMGCEW